MYLFKLAGLEASKLALVAAVCGLGVMLSQFRAVALAAAGAALVVASIVGAGVLVVSWALVFYRWQMDEMTRFAGDWVDREVDRRVDAELAKFDAEVVDRLANERLAARSVALARDVLDLAGVPQDEAADVVRCVETGSIASAPRVPV